MISVLYICGDDVETAVFDRAVADDIAKANELRRTSTHLADDPLLSWDDYKPVAVVELDAGTIERGVLQTHGIEYLPLDVLQGRAEVWGVVVSPIEGRQDD